MPSSVRLSREPAYHPVPACLPAFAAFIKLHPDYLPKDNAMQFLSDDGGESYNKCHCKYPASVTEHGMLIALLSLVQL